MKRKSINQYKRYRLYGKPAEGAFYVLPTTQKINVMVAKTPPWIKYPLIPANDIGWRLGGEPDQYLSEFRQWWNKLSEAQKTNYREIYPAPESWRTFCHQNGGSFFYDPQIKATTSEAGKETFFELLKKRRVLRKSKAWSPNS